MSLVPLLGSSILATLVYQLAPALPETLSFGQKLAFMLISALLMGLALSPTTLLAIISGYLWAWPIFPYLVGGYALASLIGYFIGNRLDQNTLSTLLAPYPKVHQMILQRQSKMGQLVFYMRISPIVPFAISNILFALLHTGWRRVIYFGIPGMLPRTAMAFGLGLAAASLELALKGGAEQSYQVWIILGLIGLSSFGMIRFFSAKG
ncbi:hypothetical protein GCM10007049_21680 [Echinicola pacifica]|uniref:VTT domain-containing protein n=1 Tax=Echinicola pacifica TaxID=346377 RepID=A0A918PZA2_9BACT|nr:hypothetical protein GCM10007049_21680 [Echinicola pacifica]